jgi:hypothetical protein
MTERSGMQRSEPKEINLNPGFYELARATKTPDVSFVDDTVHLWFELPKGASVKIKLTAEAALGLLRTLKQNIPDTDHPAGKA